MHLKYNKYNLQTAFNIAIYAMYNKYDILSQLNLIISFIVRVLFPQKQDKILQLQKLKLNFT